MIVQLILKNIYKIKMILRYEEFEKIKKGLFNKLTFRGFKEFSYVSFSWLY